MGYVKKSTIRNKTNKQTNKQRAEHFWMHLKWFPLVY